MPEFSFAYDVWYGFWRMLCQLPLTLWYHARHWGRENLPTSGSALVVCNHQSHLDPPLVGIACRRPMFFLARKTLFDVPIWGRLIRSIGAIPVDRQGSSVSAMKESLRHLKNGHMVVVFPEGTRTPTGEIRPFLPGFTALAVRTRSPIVPAAIEGAYDAWPRKQTFPRKRPIHVLFGRPITVAEMDGLSDRQLMALVESRVRQCWEQLRQLPDFAGRKSIVAESRV